MTRTLALDLGTRTGWALRDDTGIISGVWDLAPSRLRRYEGGGMRYVRLRQMLNSIGFSVRYIDRVVFEEVRRHAGVDASHVYGGCLAVLTSLCEETGIPYTAIPVGTIKKHATGKGNANKDAMIEAAKARGWNPTDDNEADALWLLDLTIGEAAPCT